MQTTVPQLQQTSANSGSQKRAAGKTPPSNTGLNSQNLQSDLSIRVDWCSLALREVPSLAAALEIIDLVQQVFDEAIEFHPDLPTSMGKRWDGHSPKSLRGTRLWWERPREDKPGTLLISLPGAVLAAATYQDAHDCLQLLAGAYGGECKRFDIALDDYAKEIPLDEVEAAARGGHYAYAESHQFQESARRGQSSTPGKTIYLGSAQSDKRIRFYDKTVQSDGEIDAIRLEVQFRDDRANKVFQGWLDFDPDAVIDGGVPYLGAVVMGAIRFCDRSSGEKNIDRCPVLHWWAALEARVAQGLRVPCVQQPKSLERSQRWIEFQVMPTLAMLHDCNPDGFNAYVDALVALGRERYSFMHRAIIGKEGVR